MSVHVPGCGRRGCGATYHGKLMDNFLHRYHFLCGSLWGPEGGTLDVPMHKALGVNECPFTPQPPTHTLTPSPLTVQVIEDGGQNVVLEVWAVLDKIKAFSDSVRSGGWVGVTGKPLTNVVAIGIGGSYLGPAFVHTALATHPEAMAQVWVCADGVGVLRSFISLLEPKTLSLTLTLTLTCCQPSYSFSDLNPMQHNDCSHAHPQPPPLPPPLHTPPPPSPLNRPPPPTPDPSLQASGRQLIFLANVDPADAVTALHGLDPETTLVVVVSAGAGSMDDFAYRRKIS